MSMMSGYYVKKKNVNIKMTKWTSKKAYTQTNFGRQWKFIKVI